MSIWLRYDNRAQRADVRRDGNLLSDPGLETAVLISLDTDKRAPNDVELPDGSDDRRGHWGDAFPEVEGDLIGSHLWLLERATITQDVLNQAQQYAEEALAWMLEDGVASAVEVDAFQVDDCIGLRIAISRPGRDSPWEGYWRVPHAL